MFLKATFNRSFHCCEVFETINVYLKQWNLIFKEKKKVNVISLLRYLGLETNFRCNIPLAYKEITAQDSQGSEEGCLYWSLAP
jgi:hypothetical protein